MKLPGCILEASTISKTTKNPLRNLQRPLGLHDDTLETHRRLSTSQEGRDLKIDMQLPRCILEASSISKATKTPLRNLQRPLRLQEDGLKTHRRWSTFQEGRDLKIYIQLPWCIFEESTMSKTTKTPLRNLQCPLRLHDDALETQRRWTTFQEGRDLKINMNLPGCILETSTVLRTIKTPLWNFQHHLRLDDDTLETHRRWSTFQEGRDLKIDMKLPGCIQEASTISETTKTPLRNLQRPPGLHDDALETHRRWSTFQASRDLKIDM